MSSDPRLSDATIEQSNHHNPGNAPISLAGPEEAGDRIVRRFEVAMIANMVSAGKPGCFRYCWTTPLDGAAAGAPVGPKS